LHHYLEKSSTHASYHPSWKLSRKGGGDTALALFDNPDQVHEEIDPEVEHRLVRKIDWMILPYLSVCYALDDPVVRGHIGIRKDLNLVHTEYNWLLSIFYFGFLAWAFPIIFSSISHSQGLQLPQRKEQDDAGQVGDS
jgi:hypothetical protein